MSTTVTVLRRVLARMEDEAVRLTRASGTRYLDNPTSTNREENFADTKRLYTLRGLLVDDQLLADLAEQLDAESR